MKVYLFGLGFGLGLIVAAVNDIPTWPKYDIAGAGVGSNFVFDGNRSSYVEVDDFRAAQIQYLIDVMPEQYNY